MTVTMKTTSLRVEGMTCNHCREAVEEALARTAGVRSTKVTLEPGRAEVLHDDSVDTGRLILSVREAGYEAELEG
ncbi:MAG: heavy-metal-associated domain-containing protein [Longimicrobiaceae bacterium]